MASEDAEALAVSDGAVKALVASLERNSSQFRIGAMGESFWNNLTGGRASVARRATTGGRHVRLVTCPRTLAAAVLQRVLDIARTSEFAQLCLNQEDELLNVFGAEERVVVYAVQFEEGVEMHAAEFPTRPGVPRAMSGVRMAANPTEAHAELRRDPATSDERRCKRS